MRIRRVRGYLIVFMVGLVVSGLTAFPLVSESRLLVQVMHALSVDSLLPGPAAFLGSVADGLRDASVRYPYLAYGTDWLAFAHLVIALAFVGPLRDPVRNVWVVQFGMIACVAVIPLALIAGPIRDIPLYWRFVDCSFGVFGIVPLLLAYRQIRRADTAAPQPLVAARK
ncbi:hypothetical protein Athai_32860 [Actinocatenispora thailandica]|uniref:Cytoplasmic membrane protein n=1 Tax=Actinocatenispora thailandica TaxID=227318 RepID=A0A7R7HY74_9ACTN|nr:hypothetical protein [Actinocatenispora thailandica]BCJ35783.1 hypothetical protein Athai_32860 [Actinocatenispora thailandica]